MINDLENLFSVIIQLQKHMRSDPTIWEVVVRNLTPENFSRVKLTLKSIGKELLEEGVGVETAIARLRPNSSEEIQFHVVMSL